MSFQKLEALNSGILIFLGVVVLSFFNLGRCQDVRDYDQFNNSKVLPLITEAAYRRLSDLTDHLSRDLGNQFSFCIKDPQDDWNRAFNFSNNLDFLSSCIAKTKGDIANRLCTVAEMNFYFKSLFPGALTDNYLKPNRNCNLTSWVSGCEPGWACSVVDLEEPVDLRKSEDMPARTQGCDTCCEGFFCPHGITCMIPCPLGSYCPLATLNKTTGVCEPYRYQLPPGKPEHTCGGANIWADDGSSSEVFCPAGSYCPSTTKKSNCSSGHYCRMGSTYEQGCFKLASCDPNTESQDIQAYGMLLIAALGILLLIIYNCSDQVLTTRQRRLTKSREAAARSAKETVKARRRWTSAKNAVKKHASGLQVQLSRTFSPKRDATDPEKHKILEHYNPKSDDDMSSTNSTDFGIFMTSSVQSEGKLKEHRDLMHRIHEIEENPENFEGFSFDIANNSAVNPSKGKQMSTDSQIFKYAYAQLEKEKAQQQEFKDLTFSRVIKMATDNRIRKRPLIEISFKDLTLTLKGKNKHILRCVTGNIKPGRITSVMGPSGAGKTTLLSAIAGKAVGCSMSGLILINGKNESIHSYKKIIGFVPQDDIVHGNLTVEENLWFSAKCRLSVDLQKPDKVLVVERVIESLGLQAVRNSLVGTVEKRGISGGQRKRVNVGLEMVMEPSLLILDEPTSGLDSATSQQLLRALRREALEGVNVCMVVHQPSYALFKMFDDLILLAKGGLTVYHGPVKKVEDYFAGLGIIIPDRVNPPDHFIDILEGIVMPDRGAKVDYKELPVRWMIHKGYRIPPDLRPNTMDIASSSTSVESNDVESNEPNPTDAEMEEQSFAEELWQDVKNNVVLHQDKIRLNFLSTKDLSRRRTPGVFQQYKYFLGRVGKQRLREAKSQAVDYFILLLAGACLGSLSSMSDKFGAAAYTYTIIAVSLLCKIAALRSFSMDRLHYWRESSSGMSSLAYFLAKDTIDLFNTLVKPVVYLSTFYFLTNPRSSFGDNYTVLLSLVYCVTGIAYAFAIFFDQGTAQLWSVLLPVVLTLISSRTTGSKIVKTFAEFCYPRWALEAFVIGNAERHYGVWLITRCGNLQGFGYDLHDWTLCILVLFLIGVISRALAFVGMITFQKK
ncbi:ABC transporter G family member 24-like [Humulus lupulus]|uniref:ABC transporter G family member 24-like n=1 Tax=Humulus lupulus TaxID=3486 RepID=UPI002B410CB6|nr:ABC transporter G family member 24-like [Humulus lupulus]